MADINDYKNLTGDALKSVAKYKDTLKSASELMVGLEDSWANIKTLQNDTTKKGSKLRESYEETVDLTKEILDNVENIGTEEFQTIGVVDKIAKARKMGNQELVKQLTVLKAVNDKYKKQHGYMEDAAAAFAAPLETMDEYLNKIPLIGNALSRAFDVGELTRRMKFALMEGVFDQSIQFNKKTGRFHDAQSKKMVETVGGLKGEWLKLSKSVRIGFIASLAAAVTLTGMLANGIRDFSKETGFSYGQLIKFAPTLLIARDEAEALVEEFGTLDALSFSTALNMKIMGWRFGVASKDMARVLGIMESISGESRKQLLAQINTNMHMMRAAGVAPKAVMSDIAQSAEFFAKYAKDGGDNVLQAAIAARKLGLELSAIEKTTSHLLDFESSIEAQMEAQVLLGRNVNLNKARELSFTGNLAGLATELKNIVGTEAEFSRMNLLQRQALANAIGLEVSEVAKLIRVQEVSNQKTWASVLTWASIGALVGAIAGMVYMIVAALFPLIGLPIGAALLASLAPVAAVGAGIGTAVSLAALSSGRAAVPKEPPSFQGLPPGRAAVIDRGEARAHGGETIVRTESLAGGFDINTMNKKLDAIVKGLDELIMVNKTRKLTVNLDGRKVAEGLAFATE